MNRSARHTFLLTIAAAALTLPVHVTAQVSKPEGSDLDSSADAKGVPALAVKDVEAALAKVEENSQIEEPVKELLRSKYQDAIEALKMAGSNSVKAAEYREALTQAPEKTTQLRRQLQELPPAQSFNEVIRSESPDDLEQELNGKRGELTALSKELSNVTDELGAGEQRPADISVRIPEARSELADLREQLSPEDASNDETSAGRVADRFVLEAQEAKLLSELELLEQEQLSMSVRRGLLQARQELLSQQVENASAAVAAYEASMDRSVTKKAQKITARVKQLAAQLPKGHPALELVTEVQEKAEELANMLEDKQAISAAAADISARLLRLDQRYEGIGKQLELGEADRAMAEMLLKFRDLLSSRERQLTQEPQWPTLSQTRLAAVRVDAAIDNQKDVKARFATQSSNAVDQLITARAEVLGELRDQYTELLPDLAALETQQQLYSEKVEDVHADISNHLIWMRVSPALSVEDFTKAPSGLLWVLSPTHGQEFAQSIWEAVSSTPFLSCAVLFTLVALLVMRPRMGAALERAGKEVGRVSRDHYRVTAKAALWTLLLALPIPLLVGFFAVTLPEPMTSLDWQRGVRVGLRSMAVSIFVASTVAACCLPGGLGPKHFRWQTKRLSWIRRGCHWFLIVYVPLFLLCCCTLFSEAAEYLDSTGRISFMLAQVWLAVFWARLFYSPSGIHATLTGGTAAAFFLHLSAVLAFACPIGLIILLWGGYTIAAFKLGQLLALTLSMIAGIVILYGFVLRWFKIEYRRLAYAEALERRRVRHEAAVAENQQEEAEEFISTDDDGQELDIDTIDDQTRHLVRLLFGLGAVTSILGLWSETLPLIEYFESVRIPMTSELTLLDLSKATLIFTITWIAIRNLPGVLEFAILRSTAIHAGTRNAITTIGQYALVAIGFSLLFSALKLDWTQFGWIAGGLSVGIGFGMQEVVANFVCGLILLFERPIRVGDIVTLDGEIGTVTKIHLRATTITNFDRGEVVLPNKTLITSKFVNWTLSSSLNRITITVGVAYGTDPEKVRRILLDVAAWHPGVSTDPPPAAIFNEFADSSLNIVLRVFLPDRGSREATISELHTEINRRFAAAGIEIPFPQRDFHLKSGWDVVRRDTID